MRSPFVIIVSPAAWVVGALLGMLLVGISKTLIALVVLSIRTPMIGILVSYRLLLLLCIMATIKNIPANTTRDSLPNLFRYNLTKPAAFEYHLSR